MPATYSGDPSSSDLDAVRFLLGDTNTTAAKLQDGEITFLLSEWENPYLAAAAGADTLSANAATWISFQADGNTLSLSDAQEKYSRLADSLRDSFNRRYRSVFYVGGMDQAESDAYAQDESISHGAFTEGMHDNTYIYGFSGGATQEDLLGDEHV